VNTSRGIRANGNRSTSVEQLCLGVAMNSQHPEITDHGSEED
jgi:hypothetical protein